MWKVAAIWILMLCAPASGQTTASPNFTPQQIEAINQVMKHCIDIVHGTQDPIYQEFFHRFDAYFNAANGKIQNNATVVGDQKALFVFNKCMAQNGFPLK